MQTAIAYRGNDNFGYWIDEKSGIAFGHQRLSIVDIRNVGNQPIYYVNLQEQKY
tara:strand:+ start:288 stop:449 length:162 start_codon:yes stop_codon:yes gene_type:complete